MFRNFLVGFILTALVLLVYDWVNAGVHDPVIAIILIGSVTVFALSIFPFFRRSDERPRY